MREIFCCSLALKLKATYLATEHEINLLPFSVMKFICIFSEVTNYFFYFWFCSEIILYFDHKVFNAIINTSPAITFSSYTLKGPVVY